MARILIVDDDVQFRLVFRMMLRPFGHHILVAADGAEAVLAVRDGGCDLVFCDLCMPRKEGLETIRDLRREFPQLKMVAMSGGGHYQGSANMLRVARKLGADATLAKPFSGQELLEVLNEVLAVVVS